MTRVLIGVTAPQFTDDADVFMDGVRRVEAAGLDSVWFFDHLWPLTGRKQRPIFEAWTALAWAAAATARVRVGTLVTRSSLRHPALLAKMAATVGEIAPGRVTIGIGSGDEATRDENESFGIDYFGGGDRVSQLASTVKLVRSYLNDAEVSQHDDFVSVAGLPPSPRPEVVPELWVGGRSEDVLEIAASYADGWNAWAGSPERFAQDAVTLSDYAAGRPLELSWGGVVLLGRDDVEARDKLGRRDPDRYVWGGPERVAQALRRYVAVGARHLILTFPDAASPGVYELLAREVAPLVTDPG